MYKKLGRNLVGSQRREKMNEKLAEVIVKLNIEARKLQEISAANEKDSEIHKKLIEIMLIACKGLEE
jgi:hypothetical protein